MSRLKRSLVIKSMLLLSHAAVVASDARAEPPVYDQLVSDVRSYVPENEELGFALKIRSIARSEYHFWRGTKFLFMKWSKANCSDWYADRSSYVPSHGDVHPGNIGTYPSNSGFGETGFGLVDFDDSAKLPWQIDLLQAAISLQLVAYENNIELSDRDQEKIIKKLCESYRVAQQSKKNAKELLHASPLVMQVLEESEEDTYKKELKKLTKEDKFLEVIQKSDLVTDILQPVAETRYDAFAMGVVQAIQNDNRLKKLVGDLSQQQVRLKIKSIARRHRIDSSGSQGLEKYFILLDKPFDGVKHDIIIYLKQAIPSAAERANAIEAEKIAPAKRLVREMESMVSPKPLFNSYCEIEGKSFWTYLKDPWSQEISSSAILSYPELFESSTILGSVLGASHQRDQVDLGNLDKPEFQRVLLGRAKLFVEQQRLAFREYRNDPRVIQQIQFVENKLKELGK